MSHDRKEPTLSNPSVNLSEKHPANAGGRQSAAGQSFSQQSEPSQPLRPKPAPAPAQKSSSGLLCLTLLLALVAAAGVGYTAWQLQGAQQLIAQQQLRIDELENKLSLSDDESSQSLTALAATVKSLSQDLNKDVKLALSETDKLWALGKTNRKGLAEHKKQLAKQAGQLKQSLAATEKTVKAGVARLQQSASEQELLIQSLRERVSDQDKRFSAQLKQAISKQEIQSLNNQVRAHDEAIEAFDQFRLSVNRDLLSLKQRGSTGASPAVAQ